ncbi:HEAT repeat domain-containing protein [Theileria equi strain WA]|uniref:HEAT repeat domain-containing protein n=1 Tax=Theileria equi strain WA TaxID=1537102 RepID=L0B1I5_THEEQ|nr:HEAT repeat domain-containing protein [Theileria equi strain WA]AFZ80974.1 HEAT repeat domain-containing protein [Theileria equi strain WA]|eukprot:XP_004830640.1 HEAT repeat domain-containing protein [Theileria equi strain WA]
METCGPVLSDRVLTRLKRGIVTRSELSEVLNVAKCWLKCRKCQTRAAQAQEDEESKQPVARNGSSEPSDCTASSKCDVEASIVTLVEALDSALYLEGAPWHKSGFRKLKRSLLKCVKVILALYSVPFAKIPLLVSSELLGVENGRKEQLAILKGIISESSKYTRPESIDALSALISSLTAEEFETVYADVVRRLKRNSKVIPYFAYRIVKAVDKKLLEPKLEEFVDLLKELLVTENLSAFIFTAQSPEDQYKSSRYYFTCRTLEELSKVNGVGSCICNLISWFKNSRGNVVDQEKRVKALMLLFPDHRSFCNDAEIEARKFNVGVLRTSIDPLLDTLVKNATSHQFESVQLGFIQLLSVLNNLLGDSDGRFVEGMLKILGGITRGIGGKEVKINEKVLYTLLKGLEDARVEQYASAITDLKLVVKAIIDKPVYRSCCLQALYLLAKSSTDFGVSIASIFEEGNCKPEDFIICIKLYMELLKVDGQVFPWKIEPPSSVKELHALCTNKVHPFYRNLLVLFESLSKYAHGQALVNASSNGVYTVEYLRKLLDSFVTTILSNGSVHVYGLVVAILSRLEDGHEYSDAYGKLYRRIIRAFGSEGSTGFVSLLLVQLVCCRDGGHLEGDYLSVLRKFFSAPLRINSPLERCVIKRFSLSLSDALEHARVRLEDLFSVDLVKYFCLRNIYSSSLEAIIKILFTALEENLKLLSKYEREDFEIYFAPGDVLYADSRSYQPNLYSSSENTKVSLTKQQLDEMRYKDQCETRESISKLVRKHFNAYVALSRLLIYKNAEMGNYLGKMLEISKASIQYRCLGCLTEHLIERICKAFSGSSVSSTGISKALIYIYTPEDFRKYPKGLKFPLDDVDAIDSNLSLLLMEIIRFTLLKGEKLEWSGASAETIYRVSMEVLVKQLKSGLSLSPDDVLRIVSETSKHEDLDKLSAEILESSVYLMDRNQLAQICHLGMLSRADIVIPCIKTYMSCKNEDYTHISPYIKVFNIESSLSCTLDRLIEIIPRYFSEEPVNLDLARMFSDALLNYDTLETLSKLHSLYSHSSLVTKGAILAILHVYFETALIKHPLRIDVYRALLTFSDNQLMGDLLKSVNVLVANEDDIQSALAQIKGMLNIYAKHGQADGGQEIDVDELLSDDSLISRHNAYGFGLIIMGLLASKLAEYDNIIQWTLRAMLKLIISPNSPYLNQTPAVNTAISTCIVKCTRMCILQGTSEKNFISKQIDEFFKRSLADSVYILPFTSLLRGSGVVSLQEHNVVPMILAGSSADPLHPLPSNAPSILIIEGLHKIFGHLFEPYLPQILPLLLENIQLENTANLILGDVTEPGFSPLLNIVINKLSSETAATKAYCLRLISVLVRNPRVKVNVIQNISRIISETSTYTIDTNKEVKASANELFSSIASLMPKDSLLVDSLELVIEALVLPTDEKLGEIMDHLLKVQVESNKKGSNHYAGIYELGLLQPIVQRGLKSRSGIQREKGLSLCSFISSAITSASDLQSFFTSVMSILIELLRDPLPDVRSKAAKSIGSFAQKFHEFDTSASVLPCVDACIHTLLDCLCKFTTSIERSSAAYGLAEALQAVPYVYVNKLVLDLLEKSTNQEPGEESESSIAPFIYLPSTCSDVILDNLEHVLSRLLDTFEFLNEQVSTTAFKACRAIIDACIVDREEKEGFKIEREQTGKKDSPSYSLDGHLGTLFEAFIGALKSENWQTREYMLMLLQHLSSKCGGSKVIQTYLYIYRFDDHDVVQSTALSFWKGLVLSQVLNRIFDDLIDTLINMLMDEDYILKVLAAKCISNLVERMQDRVVKAILPTLYSEENMDDLEPYESSIIRCGFCIGIGAIFQVASKELVMEHVESATAYLQESLCYKESSEEASDALGILANIFPDIIVHTVIPNLLEMALSDEPSEQEDVDSNRILYIQGLESLVTSYNSCLFQICNECIDAPLDVYRLTLLERLMCIDRGTLIMQDTHYFETILDKLFECEDASVLTRIESFLTILDGDCIHILIYILIHKLQSLRSDGDATYYVEYGRFILNIIAGLLRIRGEDVQKLLYEISQALLPFILEEKAFLKESGQILVLFVEICERFSVASSFIQSIYNTNVWSSLESCENSTICNKEVLEPLLSFLQKCLMRESQKQEIAQSILHISEIVDKDLLGPFLLKIFGSIIRLLNTSGNLQLRSVLLKLSDRLLETKFEFVRPIISQLQSTLLKCIQSEDPIQLISLNLCKILYLAPRRLCTILSELEAILYPKTGIQPQPLVKQATIGVLREVLAKATVEPVYPAQEVKMYSAVALDLTGLDSLCNLLINLYQETTGNLKGLVVESIGFVMYIKVSNVISSLDSSLGFDHGLSTEGSFNSKGSSSTVEAESEASPTAALEILVNTLLSLEVDNHLQVIWECSKSETGWLILHNCPFFHTIMDSCANTDIPSAKQHLAKIYSAISLHAATSTEALDYLDAKFKTIPQPAHLPSGLQTCLLKIYKRFLRSSDKARLERNGYAAVGIICAALADIIQAGSYKAKVGRILAILFSRVDFGQVEKHKAVSPNICSLLKQHPKSKTVPCDTSDEE